MVVTKSSKNSKNHRRPNWPSFGKRRPVLKILLFEYKGQKNRYSKNRAQNGLGILVIFLLKSFKRFFVIAVYDGHYTNLQYSWAKTANWPKCYTMLYNVIQCITFFGASVEKWYTSFLIADHSGPRFEKGGQNGLFRGQ